MLKFLKPLSFIPAILMMYVIFSFSSQDGITSSQLSYKISYEIVEIGGKILGENLESWEIDSLATRFHNAVRKIAHMTEYFLLAIAVAFPLYVYGLRGIWLMLVAGIFCVAFACGDEYHQSFIEGRSPAKRDVLIDSFGVFWGIVLVRIIGWTGRKTIFRPFGKKKEQEPQYQKMPYPNPQYPPYGNQAPYGNAPYGNQPPYNNVPYNGQPPYYNGYYNGQAPCANPPRSGQQFYGNPQYGYQQAPCINPQYGNPPYGDPRYITPPTYQGQNNSDDHATSDKLSEDMSLKKLMHDLKEQKKEQKKAPRNDGIKPADTTNDMEINEINLNEK